MSNRQISPLDPPRVALLALLLLAAGSSAGCLFEMYDQPRHDPLDASDFFPDRRSARDQVEGTVARGTLELDEPFYRGRLNGELLEAFPEPVTRQTLDRGQERFNIFCSHCHGRDGYGQGMVVRRGFPRPPSFHEPRLRQVPVGQVFDVISHGHKTMPALGAQIPARDRWAIIAYLRALQRSQHVALEEAPDDIREQF